MSGRKGVLAVCLVLLLVLLTVVVYNNENNRDPKWVLEHLSPPYEEEAEQFFYDNKGNLFLLTQLSEQNDNIESWSYYINSSHEYDSTNIPNEILDILQEIEEATVMQYCVHLDPHRIEIHITTQTNFEVSLCSSSTERWTESKCIDLENGWVIDTHYIKHHHY